MTSSHGFDQLVESLGILDVSVELIREAMTHSSYVNDHPQETDNERLEFLGDAVLSVLCSRSLYDRYPEYREGQLSRMRASLVREETLAGIAEEFGLDRYVRLGKSAKGGGCDIQPSILAGVVEALLGATYLGLGFADAQALFVVLYRDVFRRADLEWSDPDAKSALQELAPEGVVYNLVAQSGPDHDRWFMVEVCVNGILAGEGEGRSKKRAEQAAARAALRKLRKH